MPRGFDANGLRFAFKCFFVMKSRGLPDCLLFVGGYIGYRTGAGPDPHFLRLRNRIGNEPLAPTKMSNMNTGVKTIMATFPSRLRLSSVAESRVIFWNLLFTITLSSALLLVYLKKILFDF
jgi:hypothetical protein